MIRRLLYAGFLALVLTFLCTVPLKHLQTNCSQLNQLIASAADASAQDLAQGSDLFREAHAFWKSWRKIASLYLREESLEAIETVFHETEAALLQQNRNQFLLGCRQLRFLLNHLPHTEELSPEQLF